MGDRNATAPTYYVARAHSSPRNKKYHREGCKTLATIRSLRALPPWEVQERQPAGCCQ